MTSSLREHPGSPVHGRDGAMGARAPAGERTPAVRDVDDAQAVAELVDAFYRKVLADPTLAPVFLHVARVDLDEHLLLIKAFWRKMLLGHRAYARNMVARHAAVHARFGLRQRHFDRWLALFTQTVDERFAGPYAERARRLAATIARNLREYLHTMEHHPHAPVEGEQTTATGKPYQ